MSLSVVGREEAELAADKARLRAETEDELLLEAEGDFPARFAPPSRPHREVDDEEELEEVDKIIVLSVAAGVLL